MERGFLLKGKVLEKTAVESKKEDNDKIYYTTNVYIGGRFIVPVSQTAEQYAKTSEGQNFEQFVSVSPQENYGNLSLYVKQLDQVKVSAKAS